MIQARILTAEIRRQLLLEDTAQVLVAAAIKRAQKNNATGNAAFRTLLEYVDGRPRDEILDTLARRVHIVVLPERREGLGALETTLKKDEDDGNLRDGLSERLADHDPDDGARVVDVEVDVSSSP
jgi:hypothetical protein